jgi:REP element-mobilizing transposase RayT
VYFVTICTQNRVRLFGSVHRGKMRLNALGRIVSEEWCRSEDIRDEVTIDAFVVMPDHMHGIVWMDPTDADGPEPPAPKASHGGVTLLGDDNAAVGDDNAAVGDDNAPELHRPPRSLGSLIAGFKSAATVRINRCRGMPGAPVWQRNYHDRIIRTERHLHAARRYIHNNPARWHEGRGKRPG